MLHIVKNINHEYYESNNVNYLLLDKWFPNSENLISNADAIIITSQKEEDFKNIIVALKTSKLQDHYLKPLSKLDLLFFFKSEKMPLHKGVIIRIGICSYE